MILLQAADCQNADDQLASHWCSRCDEYVDRNRAIRDGVVAEALSKKPGTSALALAAPTSKGDAVTEDESCECPSCHRALGRLGAVEAERDALKSAAAFGPVTVRTDSPSAAMAELERLCNEARDTANRNKEIADARQELRLKAEAALAAAEAREARLRVVVQRCFDASDHCASLTCFATEFETHFPELRAALAQKPDTSTLSAALASEWERGAKAGADAVTALISRRKEECGAKADRFDRIGNRAAADDLAGRVAELASVEVQARALPVPPRPEEGK